MPGPLWRRAPAGTDVLPGAIVGEAPGVWPHAPLVACAFVCLGLSGVVNLVNSLQTGGIVPATDDRLFATLGLFGFVLPMAPGMSTRSLPRYAGLDAFPPRRLFFLAFVSIAGLLLFCAGSS